MPPESGPSWGVLRDELARYITKRSGDAFLGDEIAQEAFLRYHTRGHQLKDPARLRGWLFRIAINLLTDHYRSSRRSGTHGPDQPSPSDDHNACAASCLRDELEQLPETYRDVVVQAELNGIPQIQLADIHRLTYSGIKSRIQRGREMLRKRMEEKYLLEADAYGNIVRCESRSVTSPCFC